MNSKGYKSVVFFVLILVVAVANFYGFADFKMNAEQLEIFSVFVPLIGLVLRYLTTSEIFKSG